MAFVNGTNDTTIDITNIGVDNTEQLEDYPDVVMLQNRWSQGSFEDGIYKEYTFFARGGQDSYEEIEDTITEHTTSSLTGNNCLHYNCVSLPAGNILSYIPTAGDNTFSDINVRENIYLIRAWIKGKISREDTLYINPFVIANQFLDNYENIKEIAKNTGIVLTDIEFSDWAEVHVVVTNAVDAGIDENIIISGMESCGIQLIRPEISTEYSDFFIDGLSFINLYPIHKKTGAQTAIASYVEANILPYFPAWFKDQYYFSTSRVESLRILSAKIIPNPASINTEVTIQAEVEDIDYLIRYDPIFCGTAICGVEGYQGYDGYGAEIVP